jgi:SulP family sulfate permease
MLRVNGSIYFGVVENVARTIAEPDPGQRHLVIVASGINFIDIAGAEMFAAESRRR